MPQGWRLPLFLSACFVGSSLQAATVSVVGGFTSFSTGFVFEQGTIVTALNGQQLCADAGCDVGGPASVAFAAPLPTVAFFNQQPGLPANPTNVVEFIPAAPQTVQAAGDEFLIGQLTFENGIWSDLEAFLDMSLTTVSDEPAFNDQLFADTLNMQVTVNTDELGNPIGNANDRADFVYFDNFQTLGSVRAFELADGGNRVTADVFAKIGSLIPTRFAYASGDGFVSPSTTLDPFPAPIPLPAAAWLLLAALGALAGVSRRRA